MTEELSYHHMPLQKPSASASLLTGSETSRDGCGHLASCITRAIGLPQKLGWSTSCRTPPSVPESLQTPQHPSFPDRQRCCQRLQKDTSLQGCICLAPVSSLCSLGCIFACRMEKPRVRRHFCLQVSAAGDPQP